MVEVVDAPLLEPMASGTVRSAILFKLAAMHGFMTTSAGRRQPGKAYCGSRRAVFIRLMAGRTTLAGVRPLQFKARPVVVKVVLLPVIRDMTIFTGPAGIIFIIQAPLMHILVAVNTPLSDIPEHPFSLFQVAGEAGRGQMGAIQGKFGFIMIFKGEERDPESILGMTIRAIAHRRRGSKNPFVVILMAGGAGVVRQRGCQASGMALAAINRGVFSPELEVCQIMVEPIGIDIPERLFIVAIHAAVPELAVVGILMAGSTVIGTDAYPVLKDQGRGSVHIVAFCAVGPLVGAFEGEIGLVVVEPSYPTQGRK